jgi:hypothetical protein
MFTKILSLYKHKIYKNIARYLCIKLCFERKLRIVLQVYVKQQYINFSLFCQTKNARRGRVFMQKTFH